MRVMSKSLKKAGMDILCDRPWYMAIYDDQNNQVDEIMLIPFYVTENGNNIRMTIRDDWKSRDFYIYDFVVPKNTTIARVEINSGTLTTGISTISKDLGENSITFNENGLLALETFYLEV